MFFMFKNVCKSELILKKVLLNTLKLRTQTVKDTKKPWMVLFINDLIKKRETFSFPYNNLIKMLISYIFYHFYNIFMRRLAPNKWIQKQYSKNNLRDVFDLKLRR